MKKQYCLLLIGLAVSWGMDAQVSISGPSCVMVGTTYLYTINSKWDSAFKSQLCVKGGTVLGDSLNTCAFGPSFSVAKIKWNSKIEKGTINILSPGGSSSLDVTVCLPFLPGSIDSFSNTQILDSISIPIAITCKAAIGGSCSPKYKYQWEQSADCMQWKNVENANQQNLVFNNTLNKNMYYRRKTVEVVSGSIGYSDTGIVIINYSKH
jgi:hypothetical protein